MIKVPLASGKYEVVGRRHSRFIRPTRMETDVVFVLRPALSFAFHFLSLGKYEYRLPFSLAVKRIKEKYVRSESRS